MGSEKNWSNEELEYLEDKWGVVSVGRMSKTLNRTKNAILIKKNRLGLGGFLENGDYITYSQLLMALYGTDNPQSAYRINKSWSDFPIKTKKVDNCNFKIVYIEDFWKWSEKNKRNMDFSKMEENILGLEPDWVKRKREIDFKCRTKTSPWTKAEDLKLERLLNQYKHTYTDLSAEFNRTEDAIRRRIYDLAIDIKPVRAKIKKWTPEEEELLISMYEDGWSLEKIGQRLGRTGQSVRGKIGLIKNPEQYLRKNRRK